MPNSRDFNFMHPYHSESNYQISKRIYNICGIKQPLPPDTEHWELLLQEEWNRRVKELKEKKEPYVLAPTMPEIRVLMELFFYVLLQRQPWMAYSYATKSDDWQFKCMLMQA